MRLGRLLPALGALLVLGAAAACSSSGGASGPEAPAPDGVADARPAAGDDPPFAPLSGPRVPSGDCTDLTYTPPDAPTPQEGELCLPPSDAPVSDIGVVLLHGGSGVGGRWSDLDGWVDAYLGAGYVTLNVDYELFSARDDEPTFPRPEEDVKAAVQYLRGISGDVGVDPDRIVVHGTSAGARIGAVAFTTPGAEDPLFDQDELWPDIPDDIDAFIGFYHPYDGSLQSASAYYGGDRDDPDTDVRRRWALADSLLHAEDASGHAVFVTGARDWEIQISQAEEFAEILDEQGHEAHVVVVPRAGHGFDLSGGALTTQGKEVAYVLTQWLNGVFPPR